MFKTKNPSVIKSFGPKGVKVTEEVAAEPSFRKYAHLAPREPDFFCLRIDADEYSPVSFDRYMPLFERYREAVTIFFNACSFSGAADRIVECRDKGLDIQSHAFYHHTYADYRSNRHNIRKARHFFSDLGVDTIGFAAPLGRWNPSLMKALADEGYGYSSDFSYDYMGFPSYPASGGSRVLEIPVFPVAPELFFRAGIEDVPFVAAYYKKAIDDMCACGLPVIIYAHTDPAMPMVPPLLDEVAAYALGRKGLRPVSMTGLFRDWTENRECGDIGEIRMEGGLPVPCPEYSGEPAVLKRSDRIKRGVKRFLDFEKVTPAEELRCGAARKMLKLLARKTNRRR